MDINDNKLKKFYTVSAAIGYILCSLYAFIYCASYGLVHLHLPISSESVLSGVFDDFFYFSEATVVVLLVFAIVCVGSYLALLRSRIAASTHNPAFGARLVERMRNMLKWSLKMRLFPAHFCAKSNLV